MFVVSEPVLQTEILQSGTTEQAFTTHIFVHFDILKFPCLHVGYFFVEAMESNCEVELACT